MRALGIQQHRVAAVHEVTASPANFPCFGVLGYRAERDIRRLRRLSKVVAYANKVQIRGNEDDCAGASLATAVGNVLDQRRKDRRREMLEPGVGGFRGRKTVDA